MKIVEVIWQDASIEESHQPLDSDVKPLERIQVGYLLEDNDEYIVLTYGLIKNFHKGEDACDMKFALPKSMITEIKEIK